jgi:hypothetical protein
MFDWLKRSGRGRRPQVDAVAERFLRPMTLLLAWKGEADRYAERMKLGQVKFPACRQHDASVETIWRNTVSEALIQMIGFGASDLTLLANVGMQRDVLHRFHEGRPHLSMPQPSGDELDQTIQAVWQAYLYLSKLGEELMDAATYSYDLRKQNKDILSDLQTQTRKLATQWDDERRLTELPLTFMEAVYADVNQKAKSMALSAKFGPGHAGMANFVELVRRHGGAEADAQAVQQSLDRILAARTPDDIRK